VYLYQISWLARPTYLQHRLAIWVFLNAAEYLFVLKTDFYSFIMSLSTQKALYRPTYGRSSKLNLEKRFKFIRAAAVHMYVGRIGDGRRKRFNIFTIEHVKVNFRKYLCGNMSDTSSVKIF
jgi:hypothetical protein